MALPAACVSATRRIIATFLRPPIPNVTPSVSPLYLSRLGYLSLHHTELHALRTIPTQTLHITTKTSRKRVICGPKSSWSRVPSRSFFLESPLRTDPSRARAFPISPTFPHIWSCSEPETDHFVFAAVFLSFSRRQWWFFFGSFFIMGSGTVQYMELGAISKFLNSLDENEVKDGGLSFETFRTADVFASTMSRVILARSEALVRLACDAVVSGSFGDDVKSVAGHLLLSLWEVESGRVLILRHLRVPEFASLYVRQVDVREYNESIHLLLSTAFQTRSPSASESEKEQELAHQRISMRKALPLVSLALLEKLSSDPSTHRTIVESGALEATTKLMAGVGTQIPIGSLLLCNLSTSEYGRQALLSKRIASFVLALITDEKSPLAKVYNDPVATNFAPVHFQALLANLYRSNSRQLTLEAPLYVNALTDGQRKELLEYQLEWQLNKQRFMHVAVGMMFAIASGLAWGAIRAIARNKRRGLGMPMMRAALQGATRAAIGSPLLVSSAFAINEIQSSLNDDRLFITWAVLSSTAIVFGLNFILAAAPFSLAPALLGTYAAQMPSHAERTAKELQLTDFQNKVRERKLKGNALNKELDDMMKDDK